MLQNKINKFETKVSLSAQVADSIKALIKDNTLQPGDQLPNELVLTDQLNVSRSTVREAIKQLVTQNILEVRRGKGTFVSAQPGVMKDPFGFEMLDNVDVLIHLFEARLIMEPEIAALAAKRADEKDKEALTKTYEKMVKVIEQDLNHAHEDFEFHKILAMSCKNPVLERIIPILNESIIKGVLATHDDTHRLHVLEHHKKLLECVYEGDEDGARNAMRAHIETGISSVSQKNHY